MIVRKSMTNNNEAKILSTAMAASDLDHWQLDMHAAVSGGNMANLSA